MPTLNGFTRPADPIVNADLEASVKSALGQSDVTVRVEPTDIYVSGSGVSESNRSTIQGAISGYVYTAPSAGAPSWSNITDKPSSFTPSTHSHTQSDITGLAASLTAKSDTTHNHDTAYEAKNSNIQLHVASVSNPHATTKSQVGLGSVDNTADAAKPISTATQSALDAKSALTHSHDASYAAISHTHTTLPTTAYAALANGTTAMALGTNGTVKVTPTATATLTTTVPAAGSRCQVIILTSGVTSFTLTFGTGFKPTATLATGTTAARVFVLSFISDGTSLYEISRTVAMVA
jgi:hypothetical protein